jgi:hypothetical protein
MLNDKTMKLGLRLPEYPEFAEGIRSGETGV